MSKVYTITLSSKHKLWNFHRYSLVLYNRGGASEASVATLTGDVDGSSQYMYVWYVRQALRPITPRACANDAESAIFEIHFYQERKLWGKKKDLLCSGVGSNLGLMHCRPLPLPPSQWGSGSSGLQILLLYCWLLCCSECWLQWETIAIMDIWRRPTD